MVVLVVLVAVGLLVCWFTKIGLPWAKTYKMAELQKNIRVTIQLNPDKILGGEFWHITKAPSVFRFSELPISVDFVLPGGKVVPGQFVDVAVYTLGEIPHELCRLATDYGNASFVGHMLAKKAKLTDMMYVWKCVLIDNL